MSDKDKSFFIEAYFDKWEADIKRAAELLADRYHLEGILVLSCYLGALAALRFPNPEHGDREAYVKAVLEYSGKSDFFELIDLLLLYQWPSSKLSDVREYEKLKDYAGLVEALKGKYGKEADVKENEKARYVAQADVSAQVLAAKIPGFDEANFRAKLPLFSLAQILYRYVRCDAVHSAGFPLLNESVDAEGKVSYKPNHAITSDVLLETTRAVLSNLRRECLAKGRWPWEL